MRRLGLLVAISTMAIAILPTPAGAQASQRSAQGDCTREVERRGFTVVSTSNFQQSRDGWQLDITARDHRGRVTSGTCFVETRSGDVSLYGFGWGGSGTVDRFEFACASKDERYRECQLPIDGRARLVRRKSDAPCIQGSSWGQKGDRVWVDRGCRATFEVVRGGGGGGGGGGSRTVECRSDGGRYRECEAPRGYSARLVEDYTSGKCRTPGSWGSRDGVVWVTNGCKGRFELTRSGGGGGGGSGGAAAAERACLGEAQRRGLRVVDWDAARPVQGGYSMQLRLRQGNQPVRAGQCTYRKSNGQVDLRY